MTVHALAAGDLGSGPRAEVSGAFAAADRRLSLACAGLVFLAAGFPGVAVPSAASTVTNSSLPVVWVEAGPATCGPAGATFTLFLDGDSDAAGRQALDGDLNVRFAVGSNHRSLGRGAPSVSGNGYTGSSSKETSHLGEALIPSGVTFHKLTVNTRNATPTALDIQFGDLTPVGEVHVNLGGLWTTSGYSVGSPALGSVQVHFREGGECSSLADTKVVVADPVASFGTGSSSAGEGAGTQNVTVNLSKPAASAVTVDYQVGGTASSSGDFTITGSGSVTVAQGSSTGTIEVAITDDADDETDEAVILTLDAGTGYTVGSPSSHTLTITDNDDPPATDPVASFATGSSSAGEGAGTQNVTVNLSKPAASAVTVDYQVGGTASSSGDFTITGSGSVTVAQGSSAGTIAVAITDDADDETSETVILTLDAGTGYTVGSPSSHTLTITDNDDPPATDPVASFATGSSSAGEGAGTQNVTVNLSKPAASAVTVDYQVGGTASSSGDFTITGSGSLTLAPGSSTGTIPVAITDDGDDETDETVVLTLDAGTGYTVGSPSSHTLTITDNDDPPATDPVASFATGSSSAGEGAGTQNVTVNLSKPAASAVTVDYQVGGTASSSGDFTITGSGSVTVAQGSSTGTIAVAITDDADDETSETVILTLDTGTGYTVGSPSSHTLTITDNDDPPATDPMASFSTGSSSAGEGAGTRHVPVRLSKPASSPVTVDYRVGGTASSGDFTITGGGSVTVAQGSSTGTIAVTITDDGDDETDETVILTLDAGTGYTVGSPSSHTLTITDNDDPPATDPMASFSTGSSSAGEGAGTRHVPVRLSKPASSPVTVDYRVGGTASSGDFTITGGGSVTVAQGSSTGTIAVTITDDGDDETDETVVLTLDTGTGYSVGNPSSHKLMIHDDDRAPSTHGAGTGSGSTGSTGGASSNQPPTVGLSCSPCAVDVGGRARVTATASDPDGDPLDYSWEATGGRLTGATRGPNVGWVSPSRPGPYRIEVSVSDGHGGVAVAEAVVEVIAANDEPSFGRDSYRFELPEKTAGPLVLGSVTATDPNGGPILYQPLSGDWDRFGLGPEDGVLTYTGGGEDLEGGPSRFDLAVRAWTPLGAHAIVEIVVEVIASNEGPSFERDSYRFELPEATAGPLVLGSVTATDPSGGPVLYEPLSGDWSSFELGPEDGVLTYTGAGEDLESGPGRFDLAVRVWTLFGAHAIAQIAVEVTDVNEAPEAVGNIPIQRPGASLAALEIELAGYFRDPDGDVLTYRAESSDVSVATASIVGSVLIVTPTGVGAAFVIVTAEDEGGLSAKQRVEVITSNTPPRFDRATHRFELSEGIAGPVRLGAVTATDPDGDPLTYEADSGDWDRFEVGAQDGALTYTGAGEDFETWPNRLALTVRARDGAGGEALGQVAVDVTDANDAPRAVGTIPDQRLEAGGSAAAMELEPHFEDPDGDVLTYRAESSDVAVVTAAVAGAVLTVTPIGPGTAVVTVTAEDPDGLSAEQVVPVGVGFGGRPEVLGESLAAMARSHLASVRMTLGRRLDRDRSDSSSRVSVMGRSLPVGEETTPEAFQGMATGWLMSAAMASRTGASGVSPFAPGSLESGAATSLGEWSGFSTGSNRLFQGTEFVMGFGGAQRDAPATERGRRFQVWGQGDLQGFSGAGSPGRAHDGDLRTGYLGVDAELGSRWLVGVAVARSAGGSDWRVDATEGRLTTTMTSALPYARWSDGVTSVWAISAVGRGDAENSASASGRTENSDLRLGLGSVELRRAMALTVGGASFGLRADAGWAQLRTDEGTDGLSGLAVGVNQQRVGAEVSRSFEVSGGSVLPFGEVHLRRDGGEGATGSGVELAVGLRAQSGIVRLDAQGRLLVVHSADDYRERGVGLTLTVGEMGEEGLSVAVSPRWGDAAHAGGALWREQLAQRSTLAFAPPLWTLETRGDYRMRLGGGLLTLFGGYSDSVMGHRLLIGGTWDPFARRIAPVDGRETRVAATPARRPASLETPTSDEPPDAPAPAEELATEPPAEGQPSPVVIPPLPEVTSEEVAAPAPELDPAPIPAPAPPDTPPDPEEGTEEPAPPVEGGTPAPVPGSPADLNQPPVFSATEYVFRSPDMRSAGPRWRRVGVVRARDPEGSPVTYSLSEGDRSRFRVDLRSGVIVRIGTSAEDPATERPDGFVLTVSARDRDGGIATVTVRVLPDRVEPGG